MTHTYTHTHMHKHTRTHTLVLLAAGKVKTQDTNYDCDFESDYRDSDRKLIYDINLRDSARMALRKLKLSG